MNRRALVVLTGLVAVGAFTGATVLHGRLTGTAGAPVEQGTLVRFHSPVIGPAGAPVTIVEFFDPSCEACRAFYPVVKQIMGAFPEEVRLVMRYTPLHKGSDEAVGILEAARRQDKFEPVLEALLEQQPEWAVHDDPELGRAWELARMAGLDVQQGRRDAQLPEVAKLLEVDVADGKTNGVKGTPTFFVNGKPLPSFGPQELFDLVRAEVEVARSRSSPALK